MHPFNEILLRGDAPSPAKKRTRKRKLKPQARRAYCIRSIGPGQEFIDIQSNEDHSVYLRVTIQKRRAGKLVQQSVGMYLTHEQALELIYAL